MQNFKKLSYLLSSNERRRAFLLLVMILLMALIDMLGIASIVPFIAILTSPELIDTNVYLSKGYDWDLDNLFKFLKKILNNKKKTFPDEDISVWKHRENQKKLTYEKIKYLN